MFELYTELRNEILNADTHETLQAAKKKTVDAFYAYSISSAMNSDLSNLTNKKDEELFLKLKQEAGL